MANVEVLCTDDAITLNLEDFETEEGINKVFSNVLELKWLANGKVDVTVLTSGWLLDELGIELTLLMANEDLDIGSEEVKVIVKLMMALEMDIVFEELESDDMEDCSLVLEVEKAFPLVVMELRRLEKLLIGRTVDDVFDAEDSVNFTVNSLLEFGFGAG